MTPSPCIVDTNVALVSNNASSAGPRCVIACVKALADITKSGQVVIDDKWLLIAEYRKKLNQSGQPGPGDAFLKWLLTNQGNSQRCAQVVLTPLPGDSEDFSEFPESLRVVGFDRSDRKFVALALAHGGSPPILQAVDSKWWGWRQNLEDEAVAVAFLCETEIAAMHEKKMATT